LRILQAWPANEATKIAKVPIEGTPKKLFIDGDRALVYVSVPSAKQAPGSSNDAMMYGGSSECTYGYDCIPSGDGTATKVLVFDITNRSAPTKLREIELSGSLLAARKIGSAVHTVVVDAPASIDLKLYPENLDCDYQGDIVSQKAKTI